MAAELSRYPAAMTYPQDGAISMRDRLRTAVMRPVAPSAGDVSSEAMSVQELEEASHFATDKERLVGLVAAPLAAAIAFLVMAALVANDPPAHLKSGSIDPRHVSVGVYHNLELVLIGLSLVMLATALWRKRLFLGIATALYGLGLFNLHYWGFGVPFVMAGSWLLVRAYRLQQQLRLATSAPTTRITKRAAGSR
jgi:hypothetical protein